MADSLVLGRYRRIEALGRGGSGAVELYWDTRIQRRVAIKRMPLEAGADYAPGLLEARTGAMLSHPSIVGVLDFETVGDEALLIMEAIEGPSLRRIIEDTPPACFDLDILSSIATGIANALDFAHENQVLHLDVKPDNVLITMNGTTKVSDFGISELAGAGGFGQASGGTIGYMPPEQIEGAALDERCDEFAFAMVIYEMLTGQTPYKAKTLNASLKKMRKGDIALPSQLRDDIDPELDAVLMTALAPNRNERFDTVAEFFSQLLPWLGDAREGVDKLRAVVQMDAPENEEDYAWEEDAPRRSLRLSPRQKAVLGRMLSAALCWWTAFLGLNAFTVLGAPVAAFIGLLAAVACLVKPAFGGLIALGMLAAGLIGATPGLQALGAGLAVVAVLWMAALGREQLVRSSTAVDVSCALSTGVLGLFGATALAPFLCGALLDAKRAACAGFVAGVAALALHALSGTWPLLNLGFFPVGTDFSTLAATFAAPGAWIVLAGWTLSAVFMSLSCSRETRVSLIIGSAITAILLALTCAAAQWATTGAWALPAAEVLVPIGISMVLAAFGAALLIENVYEGEG